MEYVKGDFISDIRNVFYKIEEFYKNEDDNIVALVKNVLTEKQNYIPIEAFKCKLDVVEDTLLNIILNEYIDNFDIFTKKEDGTFKYFAQKYQGVIKNKDYEVLPLKSYTLRKKVCYFRELWS